MADRSETPEQKPPTVTRAAPANRKFPCSQCGARLDFDPRAESLKCPYCGHREEIAADSSDVQERDFEEYLDKITGEQLTLDGRSSQVRCTGCGAMILLEDKIVTDKCPYCATHLENKPETAQAMIVPESLLPFKHDFRNAREAYERWISSLWFAPNSLKKLAALGQLNGVYVPFWTYDSMTYSPYSGQRGINYTDTETYTERNANGETETKTRTVVRTVWYPVSGEVQHFFDDVLVCASTSLPQDKINGLAPWDLHDLVNFRAEYLSGFKTERYSVDLESGFQAARDVMDGKIQSLIRQDIGGDQQIIDHYRTQHIGVTFKHVLLPVWLASYRYHDKVYRILVNARTGRVVGERPWSWWKIGMAVAGAVLLTGVVVYIVTLLQK